MRTLRRNHWSGAALVLGAALALCGMVHHAQANSASTLSHGRILRNNDKTRYVVQFIASTDEEREAAQQEINKLQSNSSGVDVFFVYKTGFWGAALGLTDRQKKDLFASGTIAAIALDANTSLVQPTSVRAVDNFTQVAQLSELSLLRDTNLTNNGNGRRLTPSGLYASIAHLGAEVASSLESKFRRLFTQQQLRRSLQFDNGEVDTQAQNVNSLLWNLDVIDDANANDFDFLYGYEETGDNIDVYVVATGINTNHVDFDGRAERGENFSQDDDNNDCQGHGTAIAGTVGGSLAGVAKQTRLISVKVFGGCSEQNDSSHTNTSVILKGLEYVRMQANKASEGRRTVVVLPVQGPANSVLDAAITSATDAGIVVVVPTGNSNDTACNYSPQRVPSALTVSSFSRDFVAGNDTNDGQCVDVYAPGIDVFTTWIKGDDKGVIISDTAFAAPHVAGLAARHLQENPDASVSDTAGAILCSAKANQLQEVPKNTVNLRIYSHEVGLTDSLEPETTCPSRLGAICPGGEFICNARGTCEVNGECSCDCGWLGAACEEEIDVEDLTGRSSGSVDASTTNVTSFFGFQSGEAYFAFDLPSGTKRFEIDTCNAETDFDTVLWIFNRCFDNDIRAEDIVAFNDDSNTTNCNNGKSKIVLTDIKAESHFYVLVEGFQGEEGDFKLSWEIDAGILPSASPQPSTYPPVTDRPSNGSQPFGDASNTNFEQSNGKSQHDAPNAAQMGAVATPLAVGVAMFAALAKLLMLSF